MSPHRTAVGMAVKGTLIALVTWLALYVTKETFGRTAALVLAVLLFLLLLLVLWARMRLRTRGRGE
jgi:hypothetical protein